jgi:hypothetical protein
MNKLTRLVSGLIVALLAGSALAQSDAAPMAAPGPVLRLQFSPYTHHFVYDSEHSDVVMIGVEREYPNAKLDGITLFSNSFGQPTMYVYPWGGIYRSIGGIQPLSFKWTAGLIYGYKTPYENKVPYNHEGFSPGAIVALAYEFPSGWSVQANLLGLAAVMFQINKPLK